MLELATSAESPTVPVSFAAVADAEVRYMFTNARKNAERRGIAFNITYDQVLLMGERSGWRCAVSGLEFDLARIGSGVRRPFAPSLDRIMATGDYSLQNCRLVCVAVNLAMNAWGDRVLTKIAHAIVSKARASAI